MGHLANIGFLSRGFVGRKTYTCSPKHLKNTLRVLAVFYRQHCKVSVKLFACGCGYKLASRHDTNGLRIARRQSFQGTMACAVSSRVSAPDGHRTLPVLAQRVYKACRMPLRSESIPQVPS